MSAITHLENMVTYEQAVVKEKKSEYGKTVGEPKLSEKAAEYYKELKKKYGNMEFVLVSKDMKQQAQANAASFASATKQVVLIDEEKIEKMATDAQYRKKYEDIISGATTKLSQMAESIGKTNANVKGFGVQINDGGNTSFFAVIDKSLAAQRERIAEKREEKREAKKAEAKKEAKELREERLKEKREATADKAEWAGEETVTITASSVEELIKKIEDYTLALMSDNVQTDAEKQVGQNIDFSV